MIKSASNKALALFFFLKIGFLGSFVVLYKVQASLVARRLKRLPAMQV